MRQIAITLLLIVLAPSITAADYPVIGILTSPAHWSAFPCSQYSFILSSYVKQIEASGGRSIAIPYDGKRNELDDLFSKINGIVFTGGSVNLNITIPNDGSSLQFNKYTETATYLFRKAIEANKKGDYFPIWGTCQGFQLMHYIVSDFKSDVLTWLPDDRNVTRSIWRENFNSKLLGPLQNSKIYMETREPFFYYHELCVTDEVYKKYPKLEEFFVRTSYSSNYDHYPSTEYVASVEARDYPFFATQFHPEITMFEQGYAGNRESQSIKLSQYFGNFFVDECRKNAHSFSDYDSLEVKLLSHFPNTPGNSFSSFEQVIFFQKN